MTNGDQAHIFPTWVVMLANAKRQPPPKLLIVFDPGETTGYAFFQDGILTQYKEIPTPTIHDATPVLARLVTPYREVVVENYQVYKWRMKQHVGDTLHTPRLIGCIETLCALNDILPTKQLAQNAMKFATDEKLKAWGMYVKGKPHARDAIRHGILYLLFHKPTQSTTK